MIDWTQIVELIWPEWVLRALGVIATWVAAIYLTRHLTRWVARFDDIVDEVQIDERELRLLDQILDAGVVLVALIVTVGLLKLTPFLYGLLTAAGIAGIAVGFAMQDVASNFISGLFLLMDSTFVVGDAITIGNHTGTVERINLRTTTIITLDGPTVTIPNSSLATSPVLNFSVAKRRRIRHAFSLLADQDLERAARVLREAAEADGRIWKDPAPRVLLGEVRDFGVELVLMCFAAPGDFIQAKSDLGKGIVKKLREAGLEMAVPVRKNV